MQEESYVKVDAQNKVTSYVGPDATALAQAVIVRAALRLWQSGIKPARGVNKTDTLKMASKFTGKKYGGGPKNLDQAIADMDSWVVTMRAAMPVVKEPVTIQ